MFLCNYNFSEDIKFITVSIIILISDDKFSWAATRFEPASNVKHLMWLRPKCYLTRWKYTQIFVFKHDYFARFCLTFGGNSNIIIPCILLSLLTNLFQCHLRGQILFTFAITLLFLANIELNMQMIHGHSLVSIMTWNILFVPYSWDCIRPIELLRVMIC